MPKIQYEDKKFAAQTMATIDNAIFIINEYEAQGFSLTLRQLYYQFVARALIPNTDQSYKRLGNIISDARRAGLIDWDAIIDRTRHLRQLSSWSDPESILRSARDSYHEDLWANQPNRVEVWIEKDALVGVIQKTCDELDVPYFSCRGYVSDSAMWAGAMRAIRLNNKDQNTILLHLGDHDPSGIDMSRDIEDRLDMFTYSPTKIVEVKRIALTMTQIEELKPPPNPAKITDSRFATYVAQHGKSSWELDALEPQYIADLLNTSILAHRDEELWEQAEDDQEANRQKLTDIIDNLDND